MRRVAVVGCGGSGKTTIGRRVAAAIGTEAVHLDALYYDSAWYPLPAAKFAAIQEELCAAGTWVIDGNYASTLPIRLRRATHVIFLDLPAWSCLRGIAQRRWRYRGGQHDDGVFDRLSWQFISYIWTYRSHMAPRVRAIIAEHAGHAEIHVARSRREANELAAELEHRAASRLTGHPGISLAGFLDRPCPVARPAGAVAGCRWLRG